MSIRNHPFAVEALLETSVVLTFAVPKEEIQKFIPHPLQLDTFNDKWGFVAVAMIKTKKLRPKGFPEIFGTDFFLTGYRVFVRFNNKEGRRLRGLYILKSETNSKLMELMGGIFTRYNYSTAPSTCSEVGNRLIITSTGKGFKVEALLEASNITLPESSPFKTWEEARKFSGPLPFTFSYNKKNNKMLIVEGVRQNWKPLPLSIVEYNIPFLKSLNLNKMVLASAFVIKNIPYQWKKGKAEHVD